MSSKKANSGDWWQSEKRLKRGVLLYWAALLVLGAAAIHLMGVLEQPPQSVFLSGLLFGGAVVQIALALTIVAVPAHLLLSVVAALNGIAVLFWLLAHTIGLPIGLTLWQPEPLNVFDFFLPIEEGLAALLLLRLVASHSRISVSKAWKTTLLLLPALLLVSVLTVPGIIVASEDTWLPLAATVHAPAGQLTTLTYCNLGSGPLAMDISEPSAQTFRPAPMVFYIHGGGGIMGDRKLPGLDGIHLVQLRSELNRRGFVVGSLDYGLAPLHVNKEQIEDAKCAVRFLRAHASELGIDPQRIGVFGTSQGGYLAAMLGTTGTRAGFDVGQYLNQSSRVQAVVDMDGPADFTDLSGSPSWVYPLGQMLIGDMSSANKRAYSPVSYVESGDPPFLIMHGTDDAIMPVHHSQELAQRLRAVGVPVTLVLVQHGNDPLLDTTPNLQPTAEVLVQMISDFFARTLAS